MTKPREQKTAIIIGAGPAGLTAALQLLEETDIKPIVYEKSTDIGGISKTVEFEGYRMDIGGHRFFSKSDEIMEWWKKILPIEEMEDQEQDRVNVRPVEDKGEEAFLIRRRISRIYFNKKFFDYPISLSLKTLQKLGFKNVAEIISNYLWIRLNPIKKELNLEDFMINKFGRRLYEIFFESYTEKLWGTHPKNISAAWGAQRVKGVSLTKAVVQAIKNVFGKSEDISQKEVETSLIQQFMYPKYGPGQLWEIVARKVEELGGEVHMQHEVVGIEHAGEEVTSVSVKNNQTDEELKIQSDYVFSTMPVPELLRGMSPQPPKEILEIAEGLKFRDFISVGLLFNKLLIKNHTNIPTLDNKVPDNWIYIQEPGVKVCRVQIFNNWSPYLVADKNKTWIGMEYVCDKKENIWKMEKREILDLALKECKEIGIAAKEDFIKGETIKMEKVYPAYFGTYNRFEEIKNYMDNFKNMFLIGRNGMHRYNNMDHSMLTAIEAVNCIKKGNSDKHLVWAVNTEKEYHEKK